MTMLKILMISSMMMMVNMSPMTLMISILALSSTSMVIKWLETSNPWMPLMFTLAFVGGMMIMFMYIISISLVKSKKNKNKQPMLFVFVLLTVCNVKYGNSSNMIDLIMSSFFVQYILLCFLIVLILFISAKLVNSPFKALKGSV